MTEELTSEKRQIAQKAAARPDPGRAVPAFGGMHNILYLTRTEKTIPSQRGVELTLFCVFFAFFSLPGEGDRHAPAASFCTK